MRLVKYRIKELANGRFRVEVNAGDDPTSGHSEHWVHACKDEFSFFEDAVNAIRRIVQNRAWLYDENGAPIEQ